MADELVLTNTGAEPVEIAGIELPPGEAVTVEASTLDPEEYRELCVAGPVAVQRPELYGAALPPPDVLRAYGLVEWAEELERQREQQEEQEGEGQDAAVGRDSGSAGGAEGPAAGDSGSET